jgi:hypothetical protein
MAMMETRVVVVDMCVMLVVPANSFGPIINNDCARLLLQPGHDAPFYKESCAQFNEPYLASGIIMQARLLATILCIMADLGLVSAEYTHVPRSRSVVVVVGFLSLSCLDMLRRIRIIIIIFSHTCQSIPVYIWFGSNAHNGHATGDVRAHFVIPQTASRNVNKHRTKELNCLAVVRFSRIDSHTMIMIWRSMRWVSHMPQRLAALVAHVLLVVVVTRTVHDDSLPQ